MSDEVLTKIRDMYYQNVLIPEVSQENLRQRLLDGLERVLREVQLKPGAMPPEKLVLDRKIDYEAIRKIAEEDGHKGVATRIITELRGRSININTYQDLVDFVRTHKVRTIHGIRVIDFKSERKYVSGAGTISHVVLYKHLHSLGIELFYNGYRPKELGKPFAFK